MFTASETTGYDGEPHACIQRKLKHATGVCFSLGCIGLCVRDQYKQSELSLLKLFA